MGFAGIPMIPFMDLKEMDRLFQHLDMKFTSGFMDMLIDIYIYIFTGGWIHLVMDLSRGLFSYGIYMIEDCNMELNACNTA